MSDYGDLHRAIEFFTRWGLISYGEPGDSSGPTTETAILELAKEFAALRSSILTTWDGRSISENSTESGICPDCMVLHPHHAVWCAFVRAPGGGALACGNFVRPEGKPLSSGVVRKACSLRRGHRGPCGGAL